MKLTDFVIPLAIAGVLLYGLLHKVNVFDVFLKGAKDGITTSFQILPALVALIVAVGMFKTSGALDVITHGLKPVASILNIPKEVFPLAMLRPISGSGSLAFFESLLKTHHPDSFVGQVASVLQGSTETTFYTIAVYYGAVGVKKTRHTLPAALSADFAGLVFSSLMVRLFLGG